MEISIFVSPSLNFLYMPARSILISALPAAILQPPAFEGAALGAVSCWPSTGICLAAGGKRGEMPAASSKPWGRLRALLQPSWASPAQGHFSAEILGSAARKQTAQLQLWGWGGEGSGADPMVAAGWELGGSCSDYQHPGDVILVPHRSRHELICQTHQKGWDVASSCLALFPQSRAVVARPPLLSLLAFPARPQLVPLLCLQAAHPHTPLVPPAEVAETKICITANTKQLWIFHIHAFRRETTELCSLSWKAQAKKATVGST